jgi:hypothetical protein
MSVIFPVRLLPARARRILLGLRALGAPHPVGYATTITAKPTDAEYAQPRRHADDDLRHGHQGQDVQPATVAMSGVPVDLIVEGKTNTTTQIATTQADGSYSAPVQLPTAGGRRLCQRRKRNRSLAPVWPPPVRHLRY